MHNTCDTFMHKLSTCTLYHYEHSTIHVHIHNICIYVFGMVCVYELCVIRGICLILFVSCICFLAVSSYSPEIEFPHNVLIRLEAVMGIQIVSVLAEHHSTLTSSSGVELQPRVHRGHDIALPDPNTEPAKYAEEVILQWSAGRSHRPPTWRQLLMVLQDVGLIQLSQQIQEFIKGNLEYQRVASILMQHINLTTVKPKCCIYGMNILMTINNFVGVSRYHCTQLGMCFSFLYSFVLLNSLIFSFFDSVHIFFSFLHI